MRILVAHNFYQQPGGEDEVFRAERDLLRGAGHAVGEFTVSNDDVTAMGRLALLRATVSNAEVAGRLAERVRADGIEVVHFHNTFPLVSPASYAAVRGAGAAVVQTLHNFRLLCVSATLFRDGRVCEDCVGRSPLPGVVHRCYRGSLAASAATAGMLMTHRAIGTYRNQVDRYVALSDFAAETFARGGLPAGRVAVKPNFVPDPGPPGDGSGGYALFVGRLTEEKGVRPLLAAWASPHAPPVGLKVVGDGPLRGEVESAATANGSIDYLGRRAGPEVLDLMRRASCLVFPSLWYEGMPRTIIESLAAGTPVVASDLGTMASMVSPGVNGLKVPPGDPAAIAGAVASLASSPDAASLRASARADYEAKYAAGPNLDRLLSIYRDAVACRAGGGVTSARADRGRRARIGTHRGGDFSRHRAAPDRPRRTLGPREHCGSLPRNRASSPGRAFDGGD